MEKLDPRTTALVLIDLQMGIAGFAGGPRTATEVFERAGAMAARFRAVGAPVILVRVGYADDYADALRQPTDRSSPFPPGGLPANWWDFPEQLAVADSDIQIIKRQWNAFHGTELDLQLRRRGIKCIVLAGITTNNGVESTARTGWEQSYTQVLVEDAMSAVNAEMHRFSVENILPRLGFVRSTEQVLESLS
ncbi:hydrolase [Dyella tabacisoli]|uniref:Hydrolase n=1 Tax=Dyella tabacisoli TaxID=2282381 RepID=A0A369UKL2_9GAMM|nr:hydrolase [Dyella tabacisoli]RDD80645.1 hydrolase [Dyella tabacisoli]